MNWLRNWLKRRTWRQDSLIYEVTPRCNMHCEFCRNHWRGDSFMGEGELSTDMAVRLIRKACDESGCETFSFAGGEPCLRSDLETLVEQAADRCENVNLISSGSFLSRTRVASLTDAGVGLFEMPIGAGLRDRHDAMAGAPGAFDQLVKAVAAAKANASGVVFHFSATNRNIDDWEDVLKLGITLGVDGFIFNRYHAGGAGAGDPARLFPSLDSLRNALAIGEQYAAEAKVDIGAAIPIQPCLVDTALYPHLNLGFCPAGSAGAYYTIDPLGNVRPCNHSPLVLGNIFQTGLSRLAESEAMRSFVAASPDFCRPCALREKCRGGCKAAAEQCRGSASAPEPFLEANLSRARPIGCA